MKKHVNLLLAVQTILLIVTASVMLSSCVVIHPDDEGDVIVTKSARIKEADDDDEEEDKVTSKFSITVKNETNADIEDWCVKCDRNVTLSTSGFTREIQAGQEDKISNLPEGYYKIYITFENGYTKQDSINLNKDVEYRIIGTNDSYTTECRSAK